MKILLLFLITASSYASELIRLSDKSKIEMAELLLENAATEIYILSEFHNDPIIQNAQSQFIKELTLLKSTRSFNLMWEFLNFTDQEIIEANYLKLKNSEINSTEFLAKLVGEHNLSYTPIFDVISKFDTEVYGINLPRNLKQKVIKDGIQSIDPKFIPGDFYIGGEKYQTRFNETMSDHVPADKIFPYFTAQCLTDSIMAHKINENHHQLSFAIMGSFHADFYDGTYPRLKKLNPNVKIIKFINKEKTESSDYQQYITGHERDGIYADYLLIAE